MKLAACLGVAAGAVLLLAACATPVPAEKAAATGGTAAQAKAAQPEHPVKVAPAAGSAPAPTLTPTVTPIAPPPNAAKIATVQALVATEASFDLGGVDRGSVAKHVFTVKNTSKKELKINAKPG